MTGIYDSLHWQLARRRALRRDSDRCTVARLLGGDCSHDLHVHHIRPLTAGGDPYELENLATVCASHHPMWEALRRRLLANLDRDEGPRPVRCTHRHQTREAREICERRMQRQRAAA